MHPQVVACGLVSGFRGIWRSFFQKGTLLVSYGWNLPVSPRLLILQYLVLVYRVMVSLIQSPSFFGMNKENLTCILKEGTGGHVEEN